MVKVDIRLKYYESLSLHLVFFLQSESRKTINYVTRKPLQLFPKRALVILFFEQVLKKINIIIVEFQPWELETNETKSMKRRGAMCLIQRNYWSLGRNIGLHRCN